MNGTKLSFWYVVAARVLVGSLLCYAGILKLSGQGDLADSIASFRFVPPFLTGILAMTVPFMELLLGIFLLLGIRLPMVFFGSAICFAVFSVAIGQGLARGLDLACGCFGAGDNTSPPLALLRDVALFVICIAAYWILIRTRDKRFSEV